MFLQKLGKALSESPSNTNAVADEEIEGIPGGLVELHALARHFMTSLAELHRAWFVLWPTGGRDG
jgi:hypothetical protein